MLSPRCRALFLALLAGLAGGPSAANFAPIQEPEPNAEVEQALSTLKARRLEWGDKIDAMDVLLAAGPEACAELASRTSKAFFSLEKSFLKDWERLEEDFAKEAAKVAQQRLDKATLERVEELRKQWLAASRNKDLSKDMVREICDPAHEELMQILDVSVVQVWGASEKLEEDWSAVIDQMDDLVLLYDYWAAARDELLAADEAWARKSYLKKALADPLPYEHATLAALDRAARLATVMPDKDRKTILANEADLTQLDEQEAAGILQLNRMRVRAGLSALRVDLKLCDAGRGHSADMIEHDFFAHESPVPGKKTPGDRAAKAGTSGGAENIAFGQQSGHAAIEAWWYSPGHHRNMMGNHSRVGLGRHEFHWTQMFG